MNTRRQKYDNKHKVMFRQPASGDPLIALQSVVALWRKHALADSTGQRRNRASSEYVRQCLKGGCIDSFPRKNSL